MSAVHSLIADGVEQFKRHHAGASPLAIIAEKDALLIAAYEGKLRLKGIPLRIGQVDVKFLARPGEGHSLALITTELPGARSGVAILEYSGS